MEAVVKERAQTPVPLREKREKIAISDLTLVYGRQDILCRINLTVYEGEFFVVMGPSGCGKSTLLRLIGGLERPTGGTLTIDGEPVNGLHPDVRIMFQDARLLPWRKVIDNVALGLPKEKREQAVSALRQVGLLDRANEWPDVLSGGQKQRVALARALASRLRVLLLDEPLGALDALTRIEMQQLIETLWQAHRFTTILITHDVEEAVAMADRVILIEDGRVAAEWEVPFPRPRQRGQAAFAALTAQVLKRVLESGTTQPGEEGEAASVAVVSEAYG